MKAPLAVAVVMALALTLCALSVFVWDDSGTLVPPPEAEAESFVRALATHRYGPALSHVTDELRARGTGPLRSRQEEIERALGHVRDVRGLPSWTSGDSAEAPVHLTADAGAAVLRLRLVRRAGQWRVAALGEWDPARPGP